MTTKNHPDRQERQKCVTDLNNEYKMNFQAVEKLALAAVQETQRPVLYWLDFENDKDKGKVYKVLKKINKRTMHITWEEELLLLAGFTDYVACKFDSLRLDGNPEEFIHKGYRFSPNSFGSLLGLKWHNCLWDARRNKLEMDAFKKVISIMERCLPPLESKNIGKDFKNALDLGKGTIVEMEAEEKRKIIAEEAAAKKAAERALQQQQESLFKPCKAATMKKIQFKKSTGRAAHNKESTRSLATIGCWGRPDNSASFWSDSDGSLSSLPSWEDSSDSASSVDSFGTDIKCDALSSTLTLSDVGPLESISPPSSAGPSESCSLLKEQGGKPEPSVKPVSATFPALPLPPSTGLTDTYTRKWLLESESMKENREPCKDLRVSLVPKAGDFLPISRKNLYETPPSISPATTSYASDSAPQLPGRALDFKTMKAPLPAGNADKGVKRPLDESPAEVEMRSPWLSHTPDGKRNAFSLLMASAGKGNAKKTKKY